MIEKITRISNPLTIVAIFAALAEVASSVVLVMLPESVQAVFIWFVMIFPFMLVVVFFVVLYKKPEVLYAPSDFKDESNFISIIDRRQVISSKANAKIDIINKLDSTITDNDFLYEDYSVEVSARSILADARSNEDPKEKVSLCEDILKHSESTSKELEMAGDIMQQLGNYSLAKSLYKLSHDKDPERISAHVEYLSLLAENEPKKRESAIKSAKELVMKNPNRIGFARLSNVFIELDRYDELAGFSTEFIESIGNQHPKLKSLALRNLGVACKESGYPEKAIQAFNEAFLLEPEDANILKPYLRILEEHDRREEYLKVARKLIDIDPTDINYYRIYIAELIKQGMYAEAGIWMKKSEGLIKSQMDERIFSSFALKIQTAANNSINSDS